MGSWRRTTVGLVAGAMVALGLPFVAAPAATAAQPVPGHTRLVPEIPRTDTARINNGEIWDMEVVGNRVFIAGTFTSIANSDGTGSIPQRSLAAYDINTGRVDSTFRPTFGGGVNAVEASPDGSALYVAGTFTTVNGVAKQRIVKLNPTTGAVDAAFTANAAAQANALAVSTNAVYVGGKFGRINGTTRGALAALNPSTGAVDPGFNLPLSGGVGVAGVLTVQQLKLTHDESKLLVVHTGRQIAGQDRYGVGLIDTANKSLLPWKTRLWEDNLTFVGGIQRIYGGDISPDDSYFVVTSGSGGDRPPINDTAVAFSVNGGDNMEPRWVSRHFDSVYSVAITEKAVYVGGHFSWEESPTANQPWPGLDNVAYGWGSGLSAYPLGDQVVRREHLGALNPADGTALEWNPGANSFEGNKAMEATPRGLFAGGDGNIQGGKTIGRVGFYDFNSEPASNVDTTITTPIQGRVLTPNVPFDITGTATSPGNVTRVEVEIQNWGSKQYLQDNLTSFGGTNTILATLGAQSGNSRSWSLNVSLPGNAEYQIRAKAFTTSGNDTTKAVKKIETFGLDDLTPTTSISGPSGGTITSTTFIATGSAQDDHGVNALSYWFRDEQNRYLQADGSVASTFNTFRGEPDVIGAPNATWQYEVTLPHEGTWRMSATAIDTAGQSDLRGNTRDWLVTSTGVAPTVTISQPVQMIPPTAVSPLTVVPGSPMTFSGTATDDEGLRNVEISLRNSTTGESLKPDGTWGTGTSFGSYRVSPLDITGTTYNWSYTTPFNLTPGSYSFSVGATDDIGLSTSGSNQGRLSITAQVANDAFPNGLLSATGTNQNIDVLHLDLAGTATDDLGVARVGIQLRENDKGTYLQPNGTMASTPAMLDATLDAPGAISTNFTLGVNLPTAGDYSVTAYAIDTSGQQDTSTSGATARYLVYPNDLDPRLSDTLGQPVEGSVFDESRIIVSGRALDDETGLRDVEVAIINSLGQYMSSSGSFTSTTERWIEAFLNSPDTVPGSNYSYTSPVVPAGAYTVKVRAIDSNDQVQQTPKEVHVTVTSPTGNAPPVANATVSCNQNVCTFDGRSSTDESAPSLRYSWNFGNGSSSDPLVDRTFSNPGPFTVTLTVTDQFGLTGTTTMAPLTFTEPNGNSAPNAVFNPPACTTNSLVCNFSASGSSDPNTGDSITYLWDFGDGTTATSSSVSNKAFPASGTYTVSLTATDGWGKASAPVTRQVTVSGATPPGNVAPTAAISTASCTDLSCTVTGSGADTDGTIASYSWNFGDSTPAVTGATPAAHVYGAAGTYTITLTVTDNGGATGTATRSVTVTAPAAAEVAFRGSAGRTGNSTSASVTIPSSIEAGDTVLLYLAINREATISNPAGWTVVGSQTGPRNELQTRVWRKVATATDAGSTVRMTIGATSKWVTTAAGYSGVDGADPIGASASASETVLGGAHTTPSVAAGAAGSRVVSYWTDKSSATTDWAPPAGQTVRQETIGSGSGRVTALLTDGATGGGLTATANSSSNKAVMWSIVLNPA